MSCGCRRDARDVGQRPVELGRLALHRPDLGRAGRDRRRQPAQVAGDHLGQRLAGGRPEAVDLVGQDQQLVGGGVDRGQGRLVARPRQLGPRRGPGQVVRRGDDPGPAHRDQQRGGEPGDGEDEGPDQLHGPERSRSRPRAPLVRSPDRQLGRLPRLSLVGLLVGQRLRDVGEPALHRPRLEPEGRLDRVEGADVVELELAQLVGGDREREADDSAEPATRRITGTGIGTRTRRFPMARRTSSTISR